MSLQQTHKPVFLNSDSKTGDFKRNPKTRMKAEIGTMDSRKVPGAAI
jgi:hypothetical protein